MASFSNQLSSASLFEAKLLRSSLEALQQEQKILFFTHIFAYPLTRQFFSFSILLEHCENLPIGEAKFFLHSHQIIAKIHPTVSGSFKFVVFKPLQMKIRLKGTLSQDF
jgi:hypothetical protein